MRVAILRRSSQASFSMDVYADGLISGLKAVRPTWEIVEFAPAAYHSDHKRSSWSLGISKYYERYWRYPRMIEKQKADIFHIIDHSDGHLAYWLEKNDKPGIVTCHDLINLIQPENVYDQARLPLISMEAWKYAIRGMHKANHIITVSSHTAKDVVRELKIEPDRITVVPNGVDSTFRVLPQNEVASFRQKHGILADTLCLLNVGLNHPRKNVLTILKLLKELRDKILPIHFWKAGADFTVEQKKFIETHRLENCITYLGQPDQHTLLQIYNAADVLLSPSFYEGFGITILEAMACGTVVITSNVTSLPEVAGDAAILVEPNDIHAMLQAVYRIVEDKCYRESLVKRGLVRAKLFTWERSAEQIAEIYEKMVLKHENQGFIEKPQNL